MIQQVFRLLLVDAQYGTRSDVHGTATWTSFAEDRNNCAWSEELAEFSRYCRLFEEQPEPTVTPGLIPDGPCLFGQLDQ